MDRALFEKNIALFLEDRFDEIANEEAFLDHISSSDEAWEEFFGIVNTHDLLLAEKDKLLAESHELKIKVETIKALNKDNIKGEELVNALKSTLVNPFDVIRENEVNTVKIMFVSVASKKNSPYIIPTDKIKQRAFNLFLLATLEMEHKNYKGIIKILEEAKQHNSYDFNVLVHLAAAYFRDGNSEIALSIISDIEERGVENLDCVGSGPLTLMGRIYRNDIQDKGRSYIFFNKAVEVNEKDFSTWLNLTGYYFEDKMYDHFFDSLTGLLESYQENFRKYLINNFEFFTTSLCRERNFEMAKTMLETVLRKVPNDAEVLYLLANVESDLGDNEKELHYLKLCLDADPTNIEHLCAAGYTYAQFGDRESAVKYFDKAESVAKEDTGKEDLLSIVLEIREDAFKVKKTGKKPFAEMRHIEPPTLAITPELLLA